MRISDVCQIATSPIHHIKRQMGLPLPIVFMNYVVTYRCNSRCIMCNIWRGAQHGSELTVDEVEAFFKSPVLFNLQSIQLTGGEPFCRIDLEEIIYTILKFHPNISIYISTNGFLTQQIVKVVSKVLNHTNNLTIGISVDGIGAMHDKVQGIKGAFTMVCKTLDMLRQVRREQKCLQLQVSMTVLPCNYTQLQNVKRFSDSYNAQFDFQVPNVTQAYFGNYDCEEIRYSLSSLNEMERHVRGITKEWCLKPSARFELDGKFAYLHGGNKQIIPCFSGFRSLMLDPFGNVFPCLIFDEKFGNIRESSLEEIWRSHRARCVRRLIAEGKCPKCWLACEVSVSTAYNLHKLIPYALGLR